MQLYCVLYVHHLMSLFRNEFREFHLLQSVSYASNWSCYYSQYVEHLVNALHPAHSISA